MTKNKIKIILFTALVIFGLALLFPSASYAACRTVAERMKEMRACILCPLFKVILLTDQTIATKAWEALAKSFINVLVVGLAIFIAFHTLLMVSSFTKQDAPKYISTLLVQTFKVIVAVVLLANSQPIYYYVINPLMKAGLEFGLALLFSGDDLITTFKSEVASSTSTMPDGVIGKDLLASVLAAVRAFSNAAAELPAMGGALVCYGWEDGFFDNFGVIIQGIVVVGFGWAITLSCCFYILDSVVRFGIFCALLPFLIASWPFKVTSQYTKKGWDIFMNAFFNFVMIGLVITLSGELIAQSIGSGVQGGKSAIINAINNNNIGEIRSSLSITGIGFLVMIACCMFSFQLVGQINELATQIAGGGGGGNIGSQIGKTAAQAVGKAAKTAGKAGGALAGAVYEGTGAKGKVDGLKQKGMDKLADIGAKVGFGPKAAPGGSGGGAGGGSGGGGGAA